ncbi:MAG: sugar MFS transporter [Tenuifilum sp.]|uniref:sugar MFS transporter n=1 Tax=Tenuifilum sp. TaxID=2760880 RepID=UPI001B6F46DB|nr:sugar MFS transporter [Bacteroidales bacterium]HOK61940.1 sugar MFS transporter [Tenuifilum sp.]MBP9029855.1 sugar MFS transporter [Bacteroidales bacterium]HOK86737.1 sugar MFS transporter [Tenuifilum sp.]HON69917.1 sugar MFS transporter [Tenuifilum sp.]
MNSQKSKGNFLPMLIIGALFFIFGFVTWLNGILIPYFKISCELSDFEATLVAFAFYISYTVMALPASWVLKKTGFHRGMTVGLLVMAIGTLVFVPAALSRAYWMFLSGLFIMGAGLAVLQTAANPYITIIGPRESAARRISIMGICNKLAGAFAPLILAYYILNDGDAFVKSLEGMDSIARAAALDSLAHRVIGPYLVMTSILVFLGIAVRYAPLPDVETEDDSVDSVTDFTNKSSIFQFPQLILGAIALFFYVGVEVIAGDTIIRYGISQGFKIETAKVFTTYTLIAMIVGYLAGILLIPKLISQRTALIASALLGIALSIVVVLASPTYSILALALLGLANALVWPAIWPLAIHDLGKFIKTGSAVLIMAIAGGAILPLLWGRLSDSISPQMAYIILIPSYFIILYYSVSGYKLRNWK